MFDDFVWMAGSMKLASAFIAFAMLVYLSRWLDVRLGRALLRDGEHGFGAAMAKIRGDGKAAALYYGLRLLALAILVGLVMGCASASAGPLIPDRYDRQIAKAVAAWWPDYPWPASWKAQLYQESRLDPAVVSPVGAAGLAQFMPGTWAQVARELRLGSVSPHHEAAIEAGAWYMAKLRAEWRAGIRTSDDRQRLAQASYNAGLGSLLEAQRRCGGPPGYRDIVACLPLVTGRHSAETTGYVDRIAHWRALIEARM